MEKNIRRIRKLMRRIAQENAEIIKLEERAEAETETEGMELREAEIVKMDGERFQHLEYEQDEGRYVDNWNVAGIKEIGVCYYPIEEMPGYCVRVPYEK